METLYFAVAFNCHKIGVHYLAKNILKRGSAITDHSHLIIYAQLISNTLIALGLYPILSALLGSMATIGLAFVQSRCYSQALCVCGTFSALL